MLGRLFKDNQDSKDYFLGGNIMLTKVNSQSAPVLSRADSQNSIQSAPKRAQQQKLWNLRIFCENIKVF